MNRVVSLVIAAALLGSVQPAPAEPERVPRVRPVRDVDLERYAGLWYEVAKIPNRFQKRCERGTTAEYTLREDGRITVVNRCRDADGELVEAEGLARVAGKRGNSRLEVSFVRIGGWRPLWGDYWVLGLDDEYRWAAVGTPDRKYGWILARTPTLEEAVLDEILAVFVRNGYDHNKFEMSRP